MITSKNAECDTDNMSMASGRINLTNTANATVWAKEFKRTNPLADEDFMHSWFANAIEAGCSKAHQRLEPKISKLKSLILLTDSAVSSETVGLAAKQWQEFIRCFPNEA